MKTVSKEDMSIIHTVPDILGYNIYNGHAVNATEEGYAFVERYPGFPWTALKWPVTPEVMDRGVRFLQERYGLIYVDYPTGCRIPKDSFHWYKNLIRPGTLSF